MNDLEIIRDNINKGEVLHFICTKCGNVGDTNHFKGDIGNMLLESMVNSDSKELICANCIYIERGITAKSVSPTEDEKLVASFSKYNFITKLDHPDKIVVEDINAPHGYAIGHIESMDEVDIEEASEESTIDVERTLNKLYETLGEIRPKDSKIKKLMENPRLSMLKVELAGHKRNYKSTLKELNKLKSRPSLDTGGRLLLEKNLMDYKQDMEIIKEKIENI